MPAVLDKTPFAIMESINEMLLSADVTGVTCQCSGSLIVLRGQVGSAQVKQRAISIVRRICGMREIANEINILS